MLHVCSCCSTHDSCFFVPQFWSIYLFLSLTFRHLWWAVGTSGSGSECFASLWWWLPNQTNVRKNRTENFSPMHKWWNPKAKETNSGARKERQIGNHLGAFALLQCNSTRRKAKLESAAPDPILCSILYHPLPACLFCSNRNLDDYTQKRF